MVRYPVIVGCFRALFPLGGLRGFQIEIVWSILPDSIVVSFSAMSSIYEFMSCENILNAKTQSRKDAKNKNFATLRLSVFVFKNA